MSSNGTPIVELRDVTKHYRQGALDVPALRGLTLWGSVALTVVGVLYMLGIRRHFFRTDEAQT